MWTINERDAFFKGICLCYLSFFLSFINEHICVISLFVFIVTHFECRNGKSLTKLITLFSSNLSSYVNIIFRKNNDFVLRFLHIYVRWVTRYKSMCNIPCFPFISVSCFNGSRIIEHNNVVYTRARIRNIFIETNDKNNNRETRQTPNTLKKKQFHFIHDSILFSSQLPFTCFTCFTCHMLLLRFLPYFMGKWN